MAPVKRSKSSIDREQPLESSEREASFRHQRGASRPVASEAIAADLEEQMAALPDGLAGILTKFMDLLNELGSSRVYLERLEARLTKKLEAKQAVLLIPRRNFNDWQESILTDALLIGASTILEEKQSDPPSGCDKGRWLVLNNVLYDRITSSLSPQLAAEFRNHTGISAYGLYEEIIRRYQPSKAQLRLELLRKLFNMRVTNATYFESVEHDSGIVWCTSELGSSLRYKYAIRYSAGR
ncbi:hypothetical protein KEM54_006066 [Ascosphaera aggregata]|nr:hypothetical protein KEM54_006066 [Ascosphaera aggregata]